MGNSYEATGICTRSAIAKVISKEKKGKVTHNLL
jgi:hypothetical protein